MITASMVKELRETTGAGMLDCKKALEETNGNMEEAITWLREKGISKAAKKASRIAAEGLAKVIANEEKAVIVEVNSETDFVAKNEEFRTFVANTAKQIAVKSPKDVQDLLAEKSIDDSSKTIQEILTDKIATIGENMSIRRFERFESNGLIETYTHGDGKIGVLVDFSKGNPEVAKDVCMQIAAARPEYLNREAVPEDAVAHEMEILKAQAMNEGKPEQIAEKIVQGRIGKFYSEICLVEQEFVKNPDIKISELLKQNDAEIVRFARFEKGEGLQKREENFAEEVAKQIK